MDEVMTFVDGLMMDADINPFSYDPIAGSRVLSGEEEAVFDWISVNYLLGNFAGNQYIGYLFHRLTRLGNTYWTRKETRLVKY